MKPQPARRHAFTLVEIMIVVAIIGLLAAIAIPNFVRARNTTQKNACISNLRQIDQALHQWALENKKVDADIATSTNLMPYLKYHSFPACPSSGVYNSANSGGAEMFKVNEQVLCNVAGHAQPTP